MVIGFFLTHIFHERDSSHWVFIFFSVIFLPTALLHAILLNRENIVLFFFSSFEEKKFERLKYHSHFGISFFTFSPNHLTAM